MQRVAWAHFQFSLCPATRRPFEIDLDTPLTPARQRLPVFLNVNALKGCDRHSRAAWQAQNQCRHSIVWNRHPLHGRLEGADKDKAVDALLQPGNDHDFCKVALNSPQQAGIVHAPVLGVLALHIRESIIVLQYICGLNSLLATTWDPHIMSLPRCYRVPRTLFSPISIRSTCQTGNPLPRQAYTERLPWRRVLKRQTYPKEEAQVSALLVLRHCPAQRCQLLHRQLAVIHAPQRILYAMAIQRPCLSSA